MELTAEQRITDVVRQLWIVIPEMSTSQRHIFIDMIHSLELAADQISLDEDIDDSDLSDGAVIESDEPELFPSRILNQQYEAL